MNKKQTQAEIARRIDQGESKASIHRSLSGGELSERQVASLIATHADPRLTRQHAGLVTTLVTISWIQLALALVVILVAAAPLGLGALLFLMAFTAAFGYLFIWGFKHHKAWAYTAAFILSCSNLPKTLKDFSSEPITSIVALLVGAAILAFTWHVRSKLFPDLLFLGPRKVKGSFVFSS